MKGREPRDINSMGFWSNAMLRGGAFGLGGDMILGEHNKNLSGLAGFFLGPVLSGPFYNSLQVLRHTLMLEFPESLDNLKEALRQLSPGITPLHYLVLNTLFLHNFGALSGNTMSQAAVRRNMEEIGSGYFAD